MGIVGWGRAFNLRFMPNGPLRTNCYHRPMPRVGIFGGGGNYSYTENINIQNGPTGFWGFMTGLTQGLFGGGMFGCGMGGGLFGMLNARQAATPQGTEQNQTSEDKYLKTLTQALGAKGTFVKSPDKDGYYIMTTKDGKVIEDTYQNLLDKFKDDETVEPKVKAKVVPEVKPEVEPEVKPEVEPEVKPEVEPEVVRSNGSAVRRSGSPEGWYRAINNKDDGSVVLNAIKPGMSARQVTDIILNNKVNYLSLEDRNALAEKVLKNNPSIFENGKVKDGFDKNKLDIPTIKYIKDNYVKSRNFTNMKGTGEYQSTNGNNHKITSTIKGKYGRYAKLEMDNDGRNAKWHYYAHDGIELDPEKIKLKTSDPELYNRTHGQ